MECDWSDLWSRDAAPVVVVALLIGIAYGLAIVPLIRLLNRGR